MSRIYVKYICGVYDIFVAYIFNEKLKSALDGKFVVLISMSGIYTYK